MEAKTRLVVSNDLKDVDLYLPKKEFKELVGELGNNRLTVILRIEGVG